MTNAILAPNPLWSARTLTGQPCLDGTVDTYYNRTADRAETWADPFMSVVNPNPVELDGAGEFPIYWADDHLYTLVIKDMFGNIVATINDYPALEPIPAPSDIVPVNNFIRNPQFTYFTNGQVLNNPWGGGQDEYCADDWVYDTDNHANTIVISQIPFTLGQLQVPNNPVYYLQYQCTATASGSSAYNSLVQFYQSVQTLSGQLINVSFWAMSSSSSILEVNIAQNFGTGGSPSPVVVTSGFATQLTTGWIAYSGTITIPSVSGMTIGTNGDDNTELQFGFPINQLSTISIANVQLTIGATTYNFIQNSPDDQFKRLNKDITEAVFKTGNHKFTVDADEEEGWIIANDSTIGNSASNSSYASINTMALFILYWNTMSFLDIYDSDGTGPVARGATALDDYNANRRLLMPYYLGRVLGSVGQPTPNISFSPFNWFAGESTGQQETMDILEHTHGVSITTPTPPTGLIPISGAPGSDIGFYLGTSGGTAILTATVTGNVTTLNIMNPSVFMNLKIKL
jgi:hypothetical protein